MTDTLKVIYIAGAERSGSTILDAILGEVEGCFSAGELRLLWQRSAEPGWLCSCGQPFADCAIWGPLLKSVRVTTQVEIGEMASLILRETRMLKFPWSQRPHRRMSPSASRAVAALGAFYRSLRDATGCRVIIDSSKQPLYAALVATIPGVEFHLVHFVRDARAVAFSQDRRRIHPDTGRPMERSSLTMCAARWMAWNLAGERLKARVPSHLSVRYEDFASAPRDLVEQILAISGLNTGALPFVDEHTVTLGLHHMVPGNPVRLETGDTRVRLDASWKSEMQTIGKLYVTALTWPLLRKYSYPLFA